MNATALRICGHTAAEHADPAIGDTRCLVIGERAQLEHVFDDGRDTFHAYCACLRFTPISASGPRLRAGYGRSAPPRRREPGPACVITPPRE